MMLKSKTIKMREKRSRVPNMLSRKVKNSVESPIITAKVPSIENLSFQRLMTHRLKFI